MSWYCHGHLWFSKPHLSGFYWTSCLSEVSFSRLKSIQSAWKALHAYNSFERKPGALWFMLQWTDWGKNGHGHVYLHGIVLAQIWEFVPPWSKRRPGVSEAWKSKINVLVNQLYKGPNIFSAFSITWSDIWSQFYQRQQRSFQITAGTILYGSPFFRLSAKPLYML